MLFSEHKINPMSSIPDKIPFFQFPNNPSLSQFINNIHQQMKIWEIKLSNENLNTYQNKNQISVQCSII